MEISDIKEMIEKNEWDAKFEIFGVRIQEQPFALGSLNHNSSVWIDGEETEEKLDGVCAINLGSPEAIEALKGNGYFGSHIAIITGTLHEYGQDLGEVILRDAEVLYIVK